MKKNTLVLISIIMALLFIIPIHPAYAFSTRHHLINASKGIVKCALYPLHGIFIKGPKNIKEMYQYEVHGLEKPEKRGRLRNKIVACYQAPGEEAKGIIDGITESVRSGGAALKELISIFFGD